MSDNLFIGGIILILIVVFCVDAVAMHHDDVVFGRYVKDHHCTVKGHTEGEMSPVLGNKNGGFTYTPPKHIWACDGGELIIR